ncbi:Cystathionine gamma-synthase 1 [Nymphaea thermarum]|nr:Cystathionine gamma-synthase 1 [Nymphaea thermarum]
MAMSSCCARFLGGSFAPSCLLPPSSSSSSSASSGSSSFECRSDPELLSGSSSFQRTQRKRISSSLSSSPLLMAAGMSSSLIFRFPPNFVRQLSVKSRRNCSNIGVAQIVASAWSNNGGPVVSPKDEEKILDPSPCNISGVQIGGSAVSQAQFLSSDGSVAVHAGERLGRRLNTDAVTTPVVNTTAYTFRNTAELIDFKEGRHPSFEYGRYGNPTTEVAEQKISALEGAESTLLMASGMCASTVMMMALVPAGGHLVTTTDCYRKTRIFIQTVLPKMGITATVIDPADIEALKSALDKNNVSLFFTESPTNPYLRCVDIELVSKLCHSKGALVCIDGTFATPINQKALELGADLVLQSVTKYLAGHNDVIGGCISGSEKLLGEIRTLHHILGGVLNPNAAYLIIRGMKTLHLRVQQQNSTALRIAQLLEVHPKMWSWGLSPKNKLMISDDTSGKDAFGPLWASSARRSIVFSSEK